MFEKNLQISELVDIYGELLGERQQRLLDLYYNQDFSLGEIADDVGISRQGVRDSIKKAERELYFFEEKLQLLARRAAVLEAGEALLSALDGKGDAQSAARVLIDAAVGQNTVVEK